VAQERESPAAPGSAPSRTSRTWLEAAEAAERATGAEEPTDRVVRRHILVRIAIIVAGSVVSLAGLAMLVLPGPGVVVLLLGLALLAQEVPWAERIVTYVKRKAKVDELKKQSPWVKVAVWAVTIAAVAGSITYLIVS
jgi:uncharacterized protein (TIGR02611 family)